MEVKLINYTPDAIPMTANLTRATRVEDPNMNWEFEVIEKDEDFIRALIKVKHLGILEHTDFTFHVSGVSRVLTHQLVRHRIASYLQLSSRHADATKLGYVTPESISQHDVAKVNYKYHMEKSIYLYRQMVANGIPKEDARFVLPDSFKTHISITMNARALREFFEKRLPKTAQWEIRLLANLMFKKVMEIYPCMFEDLKELSYDPVDKEK